METAERLGAFAAPDLPDVATMRACVHCGICLPQCPTHLVLGQEMDSPRGRIYLIRAAAEGRLDLTETFSRHLDLCLGCRACESACPAGVHFGSLLETARAQFARRGPSTQPRWLTRLVFALFPHPGRLRLLFGALAIYQRSGLQALVRRLGLLGRLPRLEAMDSLLPAVPRRVRVPARTHATGARRGTVGLLAGCIQRYLYSHVNRDTARLLAHAGYDVVVPPAQGCCGALDLHAGRLDELRRRAEALATAFGDVDLVVANAAGCGSAMKEYGRWLPSSAAAGLAARVRDISEILVDAELRLRRLDTTVTYHDPCHLVHGQRIRHEPRALLRRIPGLTLVELEESDLCCGSAGVYNLFEPDMARRLAERKVERIAATGARAVVTGNPGCLLQIGRGCRERRLEVDVLHPVELLARALDVTGAEGDAA